MHAYGGENVKKELAILIMAFVVSMSFIGAAAAVDQGQWQGHGKWQGGHGKWMGGHGSSWKWRHHHRWWKWRHHYKPWWRHHHRWWR